MTTPHDAEEALRPLLAAVLEADIECEELAQSYTYRQVVAYRAALDKALDLLGVRP